MAAKRTPGMRLARFAAWIRPIRPTPIRAIFKVEFIVWFSIVTGKHRFSNAQRPVCQSFYQPLRIAACLKSPCSPCSFLLTVRSEREKPMAMLMKKRSLQIRLLINLPLLPLLSHALCAAELMGLERPKRGVSTGLVVGGKVVEI